MRWIRPIWFVPTYDIGHGVQTMAEERGGPDEAGAFDFDNWAACGVKVATHFVYVNLKIVWYEAMIW
ncbi:MAG: hypothetical protein SWE60_25950 [Thermodesulfobacteriota bacterium]|nr:hypothetical protein [Thermodesulfobacteriota bacterium]